MSFYRNGELVIKESRNHFSLIHATSKYSLSVDKENEAVLSCSVLIVGVKNQGAWCCEAIYETEHCIVVNSLHFTELKDGEYSNDYTAKVVSVSEDKHILMLWLDVPIEPSLFLNVIDQITDSIKCNHYLIVDSFPFSQRHELSIQNTQLFSIPSSTNKNTLLHDIPLFPSPYYLTGFGAELFTYIIANGQDASVLCCCPEEAFSSEPILALLNKMKALCGISEHPTEEQECVRRILRRKASVSAYSSVYL